MSRAGGPEILEGRVNWRTLIDDLISRGWDLDEIAESCLVTRPAVLGWHLYDREPKHARGERLVALWMAQTGRKRESLPILRRSTE
jgi:hypothetical protein